MDGFLDSPWDIHALHLGNVVALLLVLLLASLLDVIGSLTVLVILEAALLTRDSLLDWPLGDLALPLLDNSTDGVGDILALPPGDGVVDGLGHLLTDLSGNLATHWLGSFPDNRRNVTQERDLSQGQEKS